MQKTPYPVAFSLSKRGSLLARGLAIGNGTGERELSTPRDPGPVPVRQSQSKSKCKSKLRCPPMLPLSIGFCGAFIWQTLTAATMSQQPHQGRNSNSNSSNNCCSNGKRLRMQVANDVGYWYWVFEEPAVGATWFLIWIFISGGRDVVFGVAIDRDNRQRKCKTLHFMCRSTSGGSRSRYAAQQLTNRYVHWQKSVHKAWGTEFHYTFGFREVKRTNRTNIQIFL